MKDSKKIWLAIIPLSVLCSVLFVYLTYNGEKSSENSVDSSQNLSNSNSVYSESTASDQSDSKAQSDTKDTAISSSLDSDQVLTLNPSRCRGCGKCAQIDPEHFQMSGREAQVTSQSNLDSNNLLQAINACPEEAINLS